MKSETLRNDLFLYDLTIRILAFWATILFSLLFFTGAEASDKTTVDNSINKANAVEIISAASSNTSK